MLFLRVFACLGAWIGLAATASGQFGDAVVGKAGPQLGAEQTFTFEIGFEVTAQEGPCHELLATMAVPIEWPEQSVKLIKEDFSEHVGRHEFRRIGDTVEQAIISIPVVPNGETCRAVLVYEITRRAFTPPTKTDGLVVPPFKTLPKEFRKYLAASPFIESNNGQIKKVAKAAIKGHDEDWGKVEAIYDWVRENVEYEEGDIKGALKALKNKKGDCEELTSLFIAMCRVNNIPARMVWVEGHCYPEFYLIDDEKNGYWFPCQAAGTRDFGGIPGDRPIWQKGDNFTTPEEPKDKKRYLSNQLTGKSLPGGGNPRVRWIRQSTNDADEPEAAP